MAKSTKTAELDASHLETIKSTQEMLQYFADLGFDPDDNEKDGIDSIPIANKDDLIDVPFFIQEWRFNDGRNDKPFVSAVIMLEDGTRLILNDGGKGICQQLAKLTVHREALVPKHPAPKAGRNVKRGLTKSEYTVTNDEGVEEPAATYYLNW